jgi:hypothetical protein
MKGNDPFEALFESLISYKTKKLYFDDLYPLFFKVVNMTNDQYEIIQRSPTVTEHKILWESVGWER